MLRTDAGPELVRLPLGQGMVELAWRDFGRRLIGFVARRVRNDADAEDIVQQVFLRMHRSLGSLREVDALPAWLHRTARNAIADHYRAPGRTREVPSGDTRGLDARDTHESAREDAATASLAEAATCVRPILAALPEHYRRALELVDLGGLSQRVAAEAEGLSLSGLKARVQRGRSRLKAGLRDCCDIALDRRGGVMGCEARAARRTSCQVAI